MTVRSTLLMILGVLLTAGLIFLLGESYGSAKTEKQLNATVSAAQQKTLELSEKNRKIEQELQDATDLAVKTKAENDAKVNDLFNQLRDARTRNDGLRNNIQSFARGAGVSEDSLSACKRRSEALGALLDEALSVSEESARDGEQCEGGIRALLAPNSR